MKRHLLLRLYPRAWRERYGEELAAQLEEERPLRIGIVGDLLRGALDAHLHPLRRGHNRPTSSYTSDWPAIAARATLVWSPAAAVAITAVVMLVDFWYGHPIWATIVNASGVRGYVTMFWYGTYGSTYVRFFPFEELYDLVLHLAMLTVALGGALLFAAVARKAMRPPDGDQRSVSGSAGEGGFEPPIV